MTHKQNIPTTCGKCHADAEYMRGYTTPDGSPLPTDQVAKYKESVHGVALLERGDMGAPVCNDCHGNHAAMPPKVAAVSQVCRNCHSVNGSYFDGSRHKQVFAEHGWPECGQCHGKHDITRLDESALVSQPGALCFDCHSQYAQYNDSCQEGAEHFGETIGVLRDSQEYFEEESETLAEKGLDIEALNGAMSELHDALRSSRTAIHTFDQSDFDEIAAPGLAAIDVGELSIQAAGAEFRFRRNGLIFSIAIMAFLALMLFLKIRQIER
jgi:predicted CXXCH cytochrome family protein